MSFIFSFTTGFSPLADLKSKQLENGLTVYWKKFSDIPVVSIQLWVKAGSFDEKEDNNGISHFLEHMLFKGTDKYSVSDISRIMESYGGVVNAGTSKEFTVLFTDIPRDGFLPAIDIICDVAENANFPEEEFEREKQVILEEIKRSEDRPASVMYENLNKTLYHKTPYRFSVIGTSRTVSSITREMMISYYKKFYNANNMILVLAGDIRKDDMKIVFEKFSKIRKGNKNIRENLKEPPKKTETIRVKKSVQQDYVACGFLGPVIDSSDIFAADILSTILGSGLSSRLYRRLREEKQIVYNIGCNFYSNEGTGIFVISAVCNNENTDSAIIEISNQMENIIKEGITDDELKRAKEMIKSQWFFDQETCHQQAGLIGYWALFERLNILKNYLNNLEKVSKDDIYEFIKKYYSGFSISIVTPEK